jgi:hypothetical protein
MKNAQESNLKNRTSTREDRNMAARLDSPSASDIARQVFEKTAKKIDAVFSKEPKKSRNS